MWLGTFNTIEEVAAMFDVELLIADSVSAPPPHMVVRNPAIDVKVVG